MVIVVTMLNFLLVKLCRFLVVVFNVDRGNLVGVCNFYLVSMVTVSMEIYKINFYGNKLPRRLSFF